MQREQILETIELLFLDDEVPVRDRLQAGKLLLSEADNTPIGVEDRAKDAMKQILGVPQQTMQAAVPYLEELVPVGGEGRIMHLLEQIPAEAREATNLHKLAVDLRSRGWSHRKVKGYPIWKREVDLNRRATSHE